MVFLHFGLVSHILHVFVPFSTFFIFFGQELHENGIVKRGKAGQSGAKRGRGLVKRGRSGGMAKRSGAKRGIWL